MDQVIELVAHYWAEWQQVAIVNTLYSAVLSAVSLLTGGVFIGSIVTFFKQLKIRKLIRQLTQGRQQLESVEKTKGELLSQQKKDSLQIGDFQQQLGQATKNLQQERNEHQSLVSEKDSLFLSTAQKKLQEVDAINTMLDEKTALADRLQSDLTEQDSKLSMFAEAQTKISEMEKEISQSSTELKTVKQQLEAELSTKKEQIKESTKIHTDRVLELELELKKIKETSESSSDSSADLNTNSKLEVSVSEVEKIQASSIQQQSEQKPIGQESLKPEPKADNLEKTDQQQEAQPIETIQVEVEEKESDPIEQLNQLKKEVTLEDEKTPEQIGILKQNVALASEKNQPEESRIEEVLEQEPISVTENIVQNTPVVPLKKEVISAKKEKDDKKGIVGQMIGWFSSIDKSFESDEVTDKQVEPVQKKVIKSNQAQEEVFEALELGDLDTYKSDEQERDTQRVETHIPVEAKQSETKANDSVGSVEKAIPQEEMSAAIPKVDVSKTETLEKNTALASDKVDVRKKDIKSVEKKISSMDEKKSTRDAKVTPLKQKVSSIKKSNNKKQGVVSQVVGWFSSMDKAFEDEEGSAPVQKSKAEKKPAKKKAPRPTASIDDEKISFSEKMANAADTMDSISGKFKNIFRK